MIETKNLRLVPKRREEVCAEIAGYSAADRAQLSIAWLAKLQESAAVDLWVHGFRMIQRESGAVVGSCGFKGPPDGEGMVEIAYGVAPEYQGNGYATEAAMALVKFAFENAKVRFIRAHTLPEGKGSTRVLEKCGFKFKGEEIDPEDGLVRRWEKVKPRPRASHRAPE